METQVKQIAERIRGLRQIVGLTTFDMANILSITQNEYEAAEDGEIDFSFTFMHKCAKAFNVDVSELISGETPKLCKFQVNRSGEGMTLNRRKEFDYKHIAAYVKNRSSEPFVVTAKHNIQLENEPIHLANHDGEELDYVLEGVLRVQIDAQIVELHTGDSIYYNSSLPHGMVAVGGDAKFLAVVLNPAVGAVADYHVVAKESKQVSVKKGAEKPLYEELVKVVEGENGSLASIEFINKESFNFAYDVVDALAEKSPDKLAMLWLSKTKEEKRFTFSDLSKYSNKIANYFVSLGVKKGDKVMLVLKRHYQFWGAILALHKIGAITIPATNLLTEKDFVYRFKKANVSGVVITSDGDVSSQLDLAQKEYGGLSFKCMVNDVKSGYRDFDAEVGAFSDAFTRPVGQNATKITDIMLMYFTSGTSSYPKIAAQDYSYALAHFITAKYWQCVEPDGLHLTISDTGWGKSVWGKLYGQWLCEAAVFTYDFDKFEAKDILPLFEKHNITTFCAPPTMYRFFIKEDLKAFNLSSLTNACIAGEALNPEVYEQFLKATGLKLMEGFGQTETTLTVANLAGMTPKPGSMGKPTPIYDVKIINLNGEETKVGEVGEIVIKTGAHKPYGLFSGYYSDEEKTREAVVNGVYHSGDMAWRDEDGYFWYVGRGDDLIKSSGYRIGPFEIESVIMELPYVLECAVTGVPDEVRGQLVKATIVLTKDVVATEELKKEVQTYVKTHTAPYKYPRIVEFVEVLPKTISGKIRRVEIRGN